MRRLVTVGSIAGIVVGASLFVVLTASASQASWVSTNCSPSHFSDSVWQRKTSQTYAAVADNEGYEWGGGCWNDNNRDDTPNAPDSNGEGPDCSGYVFKTWELKNSYGASGGEYWDKLENIHGPYTSDDFHSPAASAPFGSVAKSSMQYMDAFAKNGHVALLSSQTDSNANYDYVYEAYSDDSGTDLNWEGYRGDKNYTGVRREGWTADCYPNCGLGDASDVMLP
jgi:hypothetical protein